MKSKESETSNMYSLKSIDRAITIVVVIGVIINVIGIVLAQDDSNYALMIGHTFLLGLVCGQYISFQIMK